MFAIRHNPAYINKFNADYAVESRLASYAALVALILFTIWDGTDLGWQSSEFTYVLLVRFIPIIPLFLLIQVWTRSQNDYRVDILVTMMGIVVCVSIVPVYYVYYTKEQWLDFNALMLAVTAMFFVPSLFYQQKLLIGIVSLASYLLYLWLINGGMDQFIHAALYLGIIITVGSLHSVSFDAHRKANYQKSQLSKKPIFERPRSYGSADWSRKPP